MAYFSYNVNTYLTRPTSATLTNTTYAGNDAGSIVSPTNPVLMSAQNIHNNFYFIGAGLQDTTTRVSLLENSAKIASDNSVGYLLYNGLGESQYKLYGGTPLILASSNTTANGATVSGDKYFRLASGGGAIVSGGAVTVASSRYITFKVPTGTVFPSAPASGITQATSANNLFKGNSKANDGLAQITGSYGSTSAFATLSSSFYAQVNCGAITAGTTASQWVLVSLGTFADASLLTNLQSQIRTAISSAITGIDVTNIIVDGTVGAPVLRLSTPDRTSSTPQVYELTLWQNVSSAVDVLGTINWLSAGNYQNAGLSLANSTIQCSVYDYTTTFGLGINSSSQLVLQGVNASNTFSFQDQDYAVSQPGLFATYMGSNTPTSTTPYYHTRTPLSSYTGGALNYGGAFWATSLNATGGAFITGNSTIAGTLSGLTGLTVASGGITVTGNSTIAGTLTGLTGLTVASGGLTVTAGGLTVTAGGASITGDSTITGTLGGLTGLTVASGGLTVTLGGANITGATTITGNLTVSGGITVTSGATLLYTIPRVEYLYSATTITNNTLIPFDVAVDTGSNGQYATTFTTGTNARFTAPISGVYEVQFQGGFIGTFGGPTNYFTIQIYKGLAGAIPTVIANNEYTLCGWYQTTATAVAPWMSGSRSIRLNQGDTLGIAPNFGITTPAWGARNVGNYDPRAKVVIQYIGQ